MPTLIDLTGQTFGRWTVVSRAKTKNTHPRWNCICACGQTATVLGPSLRTGRSKSCGCLHKEKVIAHNTTHGMTKTPEFAAWQSLIKRCTNKNYTGYKDYGRRGIKVCDRWLHSFEYFFADMGEKPGPKYSIDRIDNNGNYCPENCQWATRIEQANNTRHNHLITFQGKTQNITQWGAEKGIRPEIIYSRIWNGWPPIKAITTPVSIHPKTS